MEIDPDLYESSPQSTSHPLFTHREPPASLSSTKSFSYDGTWFAPVAHTATMRKGSKPSWIWAYGEELRDAKDRKHWRYNLCKASKKTQINLVDAGHYPIIERRRGITGAAGTMRAAARAVAREIASLQQQSDVRKRRRYLYNIFYFQLAQK
jgi:hypothetical protein